MGEEVLAQIIALDQAAAELIYEINRQFRETVENWEPLRHGFSRRIIKFQGEETFRNAMVILRPRGWPEPSFISFRAKLNRGWEIFEAQISASHLGIPSASFDSGACSWFHLGAVAVGLLEAVLEEKETVAKLQAQD